MSSVYALLSASILPSIGPIHQFAGSRKLVVRFNRLFGDASLYDDGLVVLSNRP
jgi:hypothetical protein